MKELQRSIPVGGDSAYNEIFNGYFIFRHDSLIAFLRDDQSNHPKFYVLSIEGYRDDAGKNHVLGGSLLKIGAHKDVFSGNVYMIRRNTTFDECTMLDASDVPPPIISFLDKGLL